MKMQGMSQVSRHFALKDTMIMDATTVAARASQRMSTIFIGSGMVPA
jgi:hypothetical protein